MSITISFRRKHSILWFPKGLFAEWARVHGNCYGTALATLQEAHENGFDVLLDIDCQGAAQLKRTCPDGVFIFILPPSFEELERRLRGRNTDSAEVIARRLSNARREIRELVWYDYLIVNDDLSSAVEEFKGIILAGGCRTLRSRDEAIRPVWNRYAGQLDGRLLFSDLI